MSTHHGPETEERFQELYYDTSRRVYAYLRRHTDQDLAETVLSEVYLKAWRHLDSLDGDAMGWLIVTARRTLIDHLRAAQRRDRLADDVFALSRDAPMDGVEGTALDRAVVRRALQQLSDTDRQALLLVGWDGLSHLSAAKAAGCSVAAFTVRVNRARRRLAALLDEVAETSTTHAVAARPLSAHPQN